jgi:hypothetical protein
MARTGQANRVVAVSPDQRDNSGQTAERDGRSYRSGSN